ncbi:hypothetical protein BT96DRAFT_1041394 [Gymnopus androsaceus JB14]|uniref:Uncharacterized protein n=1 Tax=Gymnopus androsaceus JB14 TaxID=1447944 RepID=A0A6A4HG85_9AGAR|nr:hypothetical protein BT96DRAFT_1041394 [Gymnopus androsaceus JB14]
MATKVLVSGLRSIIYIQIEYLDSDAMQTVIETPFAKLREPAIGTMMLKQWYKFSNKGVEKDTNLTGCYQGSTCWLSSLACISSYIAFVLFLVKFSLVESLPEGLMAQEMAANLKVIAMQSLITWSDNFIDLIADTAIVWRAWALWAENKLVKWTLLLILLADIAFSIADAIVDTKLIINFNDNAMTLDWLSTTLNLTLIGHGHIIKQPVQYCAASKHKWKQSFYLWLSPVQFWVWYRSDFKGTPHFNI